MHESCGFRAQDLRNTKGFQARVRSPAWSECLCGKGRIMADQSRVEADGDVAGETRRVLEGFDPESTGLITLLQHVQDRFGYVPRDAMVELASFKGVSPAGVFGVASFYNQFRFVPPGKYPVKVCMGTACHIKGGESIMTVWETKLGIREGEVTDGRLFSLDRLACVGCCAMAPVSLVGEDVYGSMMPTKVDGILLRIRREEEAAGQESDGEAPAEGRAPEADRGPPDAGRGNG